MNETLTDSEQSELSDREDSTDSIMSINSVNQSDLDHQNAEIQEQFIFEKIKELSRFFKEICEMKFEDQKVKYLLKRFRIFLWNKS